MNCVSCGGVLEKVYGQSHHWCRGCNLFEFPTALDEGLIPITVVRVPVSDALSVKFPWKLALLPSRFRSVFAITAEGL